MLLILLLRGDTIPILRRFLNMDEVSLVSIGHNPGTPTKSASDLLEDALSWSEHPQEAWRLCAKLRDDTFNVLATSNDINAIADSCEWCLMPWGTDYPGMMVAFLSSDDRLIAQVISDLQEAQCYDLLVSHYTAAAVANHQFRGAVFSSDLRVGPETVWRTNDGATVFVFTAGGDLSKKRLEGAETIAEELASDPDTGIQVTRRWLRVSAVDAMRYYARHAYTSFFVGGIAEERLHSFFARSKKVGRDPLRLGLSALESAFWIYIPKTERLGDEIYVNRSPQETTKLLADEQFASAPRFTLRCFC